MLITFAVPREIDGVKYAPDQTADLPDDTARTLVQDGHARRASPGAVSNDPSGVAADEPAQPTIDSPTTGEHEEE